MIYCSQCGTQNRDGSKFCSNCAARLAPPSGLICPMCSTANPVETVFCTNCGARLVPLIGGPDANRRDQSPPIKGLSLPTRSTPPSEEPENDEEPVTKEKIEDWLAKLRASPPEEDEASPAMENLSPPPPAAPSAPIEDISPPLPAPPLPSEQIPTWVKPAHLEEIPPESFEPNEPAEDVESLPLPSNSTEPLPDWLKELGAQTRLPEAAVQPEPEISVPTYQPPEGHTQLPEWLQQGAPQQPESEESTLPEPVSVQRDEEPLVPVAEAEPALEPLPEPELEPIEPAKAAEIPAWVAQLKPSEEDELPPPADSAPVEIVDADEVSEWLRTPASVLPESAIAPEKGGSEIELEGPLANLRGILPLAIAMAEPHAVAPTAPAERKDGAHLFDEILTAPVVEIAHSPRRRPRRGVPTMNALIYLLLALAVIVPFFVPLNISGSALQISGTRAAAFFDTLQALPTDATVLVAFDYDPSVAGEMDLIASAIVRHLVQRRVKIIAISTLETGPLIAKNVLAAAVANVDGYRYGAQYINLASYIPGHETGLAQLANQGLPLNVLDLEQRKPIGQYPIVSNIKTVGSLAMVIELAGSEEPLKNWLEQYQPRVNARIAAGVSAAVEPKARAYHDSKQLVALVSGPIGAAQYEILTTQPGTAVTRIAAQSLAQLVLIGVVILGNITYWMARLQKRKPK